jgi:hypothetical protein
VCLYAFPYSNIGVSLSIPGNRDTANLTLATEVSQLIYLLK